MGFFIYRNNRERSAVVISISKVFDNKEWTGLRLASGSDLGHYGFDLLDVTVTAVIHARLMRRGQACVLHQDLIWITMALIWCKVKGATGLVLKFEETFKGFLYTEKGSSCSWTEATRRWSLLQKT